VRPGSVWAVRELPLRLGFGYTARIGPAQGWIFIPDDRELSGSASRDSGDRCESRRRGETESRQSAVRSDDSRNHTYEAGGRIAQLGSAALISELV